MHFADPRDAITAGIATVHQHLAMIPLMSVSRNFFMGNEPVKKIGPLQLFFLLYTTDAADEEDSGDFCGCRVLKKNNITRVEIN